MKYDDAYEILVHQAKAKMVMNKYKGDIEDLPVDKLVALAKAEIDELSEAMSGGNYTFVIEEAADVCNYMVAAVQQAMVRYRSRK